MTTEEIYNDLIAKIKKYHPSKDLSLIERSYKFALNAHGAQKRSSGEPYIIHPLSVAVILAELQLDLESISAGILHDVAEDTEYTIEDISKEFGLEIALIVDGVTKLEKMRYTSKAEEQAENYRKLFIAMAKDIRVILIKIADRLHNMRTLEYRPKDKQIDVANETIEIYAPLAHRLGISKLRYEIEDLGFKYQDEQAYMEIMGQINKKQEERWDFIQKIVNEIKEKMHESGIKSTVEGRPKHYFSVHKKMITKNRTLDQMYDLFAVRVIVDENKDCYNVMGRLHETYKPIPGRVKDFIAMPKNNRYQSLHTTLISHDGEPFEVQIRTKEMHRISEYGIAAHWKYKNKKSGKPDAESEEKKLAWLRQMMEWQQEMPDDEEYLDALKTDLNVYNANVYCFTPRGDIISLVNGSTPIDFAYAIHSEIGNKMIGARVNGKIVTFDYQLISGDRVEILTGQTTKGPGQDWLKLAKSTQARSKINQWFKQVNRVENIQKGKELLEAEAKKKNIPLKDLLADGREEFILVKLNALDFDSLCAAVGFGSIKDFQVVNRLYAEYEKTLPPAPDDEIIHDLLDGSDIEAKNRKKKSGILVHGVGDLNVRFSKCCSPIPGDEILGFVTRGRGVSIHRKDCPNVMNLEETDVERIIEATWNLQEKVEDNTAYHADIRLVCDDRDGLIMDISRVLTDEKIKVKSMNARTSKMDAVVEIGIEVASRFQIDKLFSRMSRVPGAHTVERLLT